MSELVIPRMIPFPTKIHEPILMPFILTWSLCDTPPTKVSPVLRAEEVTIVLFYLPCNVLEYAMIMSETKLYASMSMMYSGSIIIFFF